MKVKSLILILLAVGLASSCKKKKNEALFVGTYEGFWLKEDTHYTFVDSIMAVVPYTVRDTSAGQFTVTRDGNEVSLNGYSQRIKLKELEYGKTFKYSSPTGPMGAAYSYSSSKLTFYENGEITWMIKNSVNELYASMYITSFVGTKID